jgi:hypothetical protein
MEASGRTLIGTELAVKYGIKDERGALTARRR